MAEEAHPLAPRISYPVERMVSLEESQSQALSSVGLLLRCKGGSAFFHLSHLPECLLCPTPVPCYMLFSSHSSILPCGLHFLGAIPVHLIPASFPISQVAPISSLPLVTLSMSLIMLKFQAYLTPMSQRLL